MNSSPGRVVVLAINVVWKENTCQSRRERLPTQSMNLNIRGFTCDSFQLGIYDPSSPLRTRLTKEENADNVQQRWSGQTSTLFQHQHLLLIQNARRGFRLQCYEQLRVFQSLYYEFSWSMSSIYQIGTMQFEKFLRLVSCPSTSNASQWFRPRRSVASSMASQQPMLIKGWYQILWLIGIEMGSIPCYQVSKPCVAAEYFQDGYSITGQCKGNAMLRRYKYLVAFQLFCLEIYKSMELTRYPELVWISLTTCLKQSKVHARILMALNLASKVGTYNLIIMAIYDIWTSAKLQ